MATYVNDYNVHLRYDLSAFRVLAIRVLASRLGRSVSDTGVPPAGDKAGTQDHAKLLSVGTTKSVSGDPDLVVATSRSWTQLGSVCL